MSEINVRKLDPRAKLPTYGTPNSAGADLYALEDFTVWPGDMVKVRTGLAIQCPEGYEAQIRPRSGLAYKHRLTVLNSPGTIDEDYRGELEVLVVNLDLRPDRRNVLSRPYEGKAGERIAQMVIKKVERHTFTQVSDFVETYENARNEKGFGSTGR